MYTRTLKIRGIILNAKFRDAGEATIDGKHVKWEKAFQIIFLQEADPKGNAKKYTVVPEKEIAISEMLETACWGCLAELTFDGKQVSDIEIICDWLADFYQLQGE